MICQKVILKSHTSLPILNTMCKVLDYITFAQWLGLLGQCCAVWVICTAAVLQLTPLCVQILSVRIDDLEPLPETTTIDASSIGIVQVSSRVRWDITFWVHNIAGRGLMGEECAFFRESAPVEHVQAATSCWSAWLYNRQSVITGWGLKSLESGFCWSLFLCLRTDTKPALGDCLLLGTSLSKRTWCFVWKCVAPAGISLGTGWTTRREAAHKNP